MNYWVWKGTAHAVGVYNFKTETACKLEFTAIISFELIKWVPLLPQAKYGVKGFLSWLLSTLYCSQSRMEYEERVKKQAKEMAPSGLG